MRRVDRPAGKHQFGTRFGADQPPVLSVDDAGGAAASRTIRSAWAFSSIFQVSPVPDRFDIGIGSAPAHAFVDGHRIVAETLLLNPVDVLCGGVASLDACFDKGGMQRIVKRLDRRLQWSRIVMIGVRLVFDASLRLK